MSARAASGLRIEKVETAAQREAFMRVPAPIYAGDPTWVPPLDIMERRRLTPGKNPFFEFGEAAFFTAWRGNEAVGRISAQVNRLHQETHRDGAGHFGFFDCRDDQEAAGILVEAAADWLGQKGCLKMIGPMNLTINEECGLLVEGFDTPPAVFMTQSKPWAGGLLERAGLAKEMDLYAYRMKPSEAGEKVRRLAAAAKASNRVRVRPADTRQFRRELALVADIFNDAWKDNWGFCPISADELEMVMGELRWFFRGSSARFVYLDGEAVGMMAALPDYNEIIRNYGGKLFPLNWARFAFALWREKLASARVVLLGLRPAARGAMGAGILALLISEFLEESRKYPLEWVEFSWILESNRTMRGIAELAAGPPVKTYRIYGKAL